MVSLVGQMYFSAESEVLVDGHAWITHDSVLVGRVSTAAVTVVPPSKASSLRLLHVSSLAYPCPMTWKVRKVIEG